MLPTWAGKPPSDDANRDAHVDWDVHVYRPDSDGKSSHDMGNLLMTPIAIRPGDCLQVRARFREPVHAAIVAIEPDGSALGGSRAPANAGAEPLTTELTIPPEGDRYLPLTAPGPAALVLLASRRPLGVAGRRGALPPGRRRKARGRLPARRGRCHPSRRTARPGSCPGPSRPDAWRASHPQKTWIFDGQVIAPIRKAEAIEKTPGIEPFAAIAEALKANRVLNGSRAVLFEVAVPQSRVSSTTI